jgi:hypothetical protein
MDTDYTCQRMLASEFPHVKNMIIYPCRNWEGCVKALDDIKPKVKAEDWSVADMLDSVWDYVQSYYVEQIFSTDIANYFLEARKEMKAGASSLGALKGWTDWSVVNKLYQGWINEIIYQLPCHIFLTCKAARVNREDEQGIQDMYSTFGLKPDGEKRNGHRVHSILLFSHDRNGYYISTIKDRGRIRLENTPLTPEQNFATKYLQTIAGWEK